MRETGEKTNYSKDDEKNPRPSGQKENVAIQLIYQGTHSFNIERVGFKLACNLLVEAETRQEEINRANKLMII